MGFLAPILEAAAPSIIGGLVSGGANAILGGSNGALTGLLGANNIFQTGLQAQSMFAQDQLDLQSTVFDEAMNQQSEQTWTEASLQISVLRNCLRAPAIDSHLGPSHPEGLVPDDSLTIASDRASRKRR